MPNWCENKLILKGDSDAIRQVNHAFTNSQSVFSELIGRDDTYTDENCYEHDETRYGTEDFIRLIESEYVDGHTELRLEFYTAWSPPSAFVKRLCEKFNLEASLFFSEPGMDFAGEDVYTWIDDELTIDTEVCRLSSYQ